MLLAAQVLVTHAATRAERPVELGGTMPNSRGSLHCCIRTAREDDGQALFRIRREAILAAAAPEVAVAWAEAHPPEWINEVLAERQVWVFESDGCLVGWCSATSNHIDALYTAPSHFRQGIASALLAFTEKELRKSGFAEVELNASLNAEHFYRAHGYTAKGPRHALESRHRGSLPMSKVFTD